MFHGERHFIKNSQLQLPWCTGRFISGVLLATISVQLPHHTMDGLKSAKKFTAAAGESPLPAWALATGLAHTAYSIPSKMAAAGGSSGDTYQFNQSAVFRKPSRNSCILFAAAHAFGGYMIYDGDETNGAGFTFAWSTLYLIVNGRPAVKNLLAGRVTPLSLSVLALGNVGVYGKAFFWP